MPASEPVLEPNTYSEYLFVHYFPVCYNVLNLSMEFITGSFSSTLYVLICHYILK